jgi:type VI secretion system protein ImpL
MQAYWPYILLALILLALVVAIFLYLVLRKARRRAAPGGNALAPAAGDEGAGGLMRRAPLTSLGLKTSFSRAVRLLRTHVTRRDYRYRLPWFLMVGESGSGKTTLLSETGLSLPLGRPAEQMYGVKQGVNWFFFDRGVVLDVAGDLVLRPDGEPSDKRGWNTIARLLQKHRPERPLDGIVLTIPCEDLLASGGGLALDQRARIEQKAACLYRKLWQAQKLLGMSFPVYVLITKCDEIAGFRSLCRELPRAMRDEMFGWSSPYTLETAYRPEWIEEAFQNIYRYLFQIQVEVFAERSEVQDRDGLFLLPSEMQALKGPLQLYLDHVFKESSFHDSFFFRGLYFCGDAGDSVETLLPAEPSMPSAMTDDWLAEQPDPFAPAMPRPAPPAARRPAFLKDLFEKKIFLEDMLARPVFKTMLSRNRTVLAAQVLSIAIPVIGLVGLLTTYAGLERHRDQLYDLLKHEEQDLKEVRELRGKRGGSAPRVSDFYSGLNQSPDFASPSDAALDTARTRRVAYTQPSATLVGDTLSDSQAVAATDAQTHDNVQHLLDGMGKVNARNYYSVFIPSSWLSDLDERTRASLVAAFQYVILDSLRLSLEERTNAFLQAAPIYEHFDYRTEEYPDARVAPRAGIAPGALDSSPDARGASPDRRAPAPVYDQPFSTGADATLHGLIERFGELRVNRARYEGLTSKGSGSLEELRLLSIYLGHEWPEESFDPNNELYRHALEQARGVPLKPSSDEVHRAFAARVAEMAEVLYERSFERSRTGDIHYDYLSDITQTEALLARPENTWLATYVFEARSAFHDMTLSSGLAELRKSLEGLSRESFMSTSSPYAPMPSKAFSRRQLIWDAESLRRAVALCNDYERFAGERAALSKNLDDSVRQAALAQLKTNVTMLVARAQRYETAARTPGESAMRTSLAAEVRSFQQSEEALAQLLDATNRLNLDVGLRPAISSQASYLVGAINREFEAGQFYAMSRRDFSWWDGGKPISYPAFAADGPDDLAVYLAAQRKRIAYLARDLASPVFAFLAAQNISVQQVRATSRVDWDEIIGELERYDNKQPGSSLAALEDFIRVGMDKASVDDCGALFTAGPDAPARDYFIQTRNYLRRLLSVRCLALAERRAYTDSLRAAEDNLRTLENYRDIEKDFNHTLACRFPFADAPCGVTLGEADPESVVAFFERFDKKKAAAREALKRNPQLGPVRDEAAAFLDRIDEVRVFFAAYLDKKQPPSVDFNLQFRVNQEMEAGASQIIDWTLDVGRKKYRYLDQELSGRWVVGEPVRLTLRWANNSPSVPFTTADSQTLRVRDRVAIFEFTNRWSLLALMSRQASSGGDFKYGVDTEVYTLKFRVPTRPGGNITERQPEVLRAEMAEVFMRLSLAAPGSKEPLLLPAFPARAPKF